jgi:hypothetical protein
MHLLQAARDFASDATFMFMSTGDSISMNTLRLTK